MRELQGREAEQAKIHSLSERSLTARTNAVWLGFALLIILTLAGNVYSYISLLNLEKANTRTRAESNERDQLLDQLANDIYRASTAARDYFLESDADRIATQREELARLRVRMFDALAAYESKVPPEEKGNLGGLRKNIDSFWEYVAPPLHWSPKQREQNSDSYLAEFLLPKGQELETLAREITLRDEREVQESELRLQAGYLAFQRDIVIASVVALLGGLAAAFLSVRRIRRLEGEAEVRYEQVEQARLQLRDLSNQLVNAQEEERRRLSRELHDQLGQTMSALVTELGRLEHDTDSSEMVTERAAIARQLAEESVRSIRDTALLLRPSMLDDLGLVPALRWQAREVRRRSGLKVRITAEELGEELPDSHKTCVYRVVQEALHNCVKHANATEARIVVRQTPEGLSVSVQDDGVGFNAASEKGMGLLGIEERVARLGGLFRIESRPGRGTVLSALFPNAESDVPVPSVENRV